MPIVASDRGQVTPIRFGETPQAYLESTQFRSGGRGLGRRSFRRYPSPAEVGLYSLLGARIIATLVCLWIP